MLRMNRQLRSLTLALVAAAISSASFAQDGAWRVSKSSGDVWVGAGAQTVSLTQEANLKPGDQITTGRNGRVLLTRGDETILVSPNSAIGIPAEKKDGLATTITQQAGSILLNVEKKNVQHFSVETPYLAAVVKGTQFRVTVNSAGSRVDVLGGSVEVADFRTGRFALVAPGQAALVSLRSTTGLSLQGPGTLAPIQKGAPRESSVKRLPIPRSGLTPQISMPTERRAAAPTSPIAEKKQLAAKPAKPTLRISAPLGEVQLDIKKVTRGLARGNTVAATDSRTSKDSVWSSGELNPGNGASKEAGKGNNGSVNRSVSSASSSSSGSNSAAASSSASSASTGNNGNGNSNGNGNAYGVNKEKSNNGNGKGKGKNK